MKVTCFKNIFDTTEPLFLDVLAILKRIKDGNSKDLIEKIRLESDGDKQQNLKKRLPSICFSGRFAKRESESLLEHSGLICLDVDKVNEKDLQTIKKLLCKDDFVFSCFVSPGGLGLKMIVKIHPDKSNHKSQFLALEQYFNEQLKSFTSTQKSKGGKLLKVHIDKSGKDVNRVCYESYDPEIYWNSDSEIWVECLDEVIVEKEVSDYDLIIKKLQVWIDKKENYYKGNRNNFLYQFASALCRYGVSEMRTLSYLNDKYSDYEFGELKSTVAGAYKANDFKCAEFTEAEKRSTHTTINVEQKKDVTSFWSINDKGKVKIDSKQFLKFIEANGFGIYRQQKGFNKWDFVFVNNMIVDIVDVVDIKKHILEYVERHAPEPVFDELQMKNRYFENTFLNALPLIDVEQIRDKKDSSYIFFEDFYYEITSTSKKRFDYQDLDGKHIWRSQISKKTITEVVPYSNHDFNLFVFNAVGKDMNAYKAACSSIGYGIHTYKKKRLAKLVYTCDQASGELDGMAMGGTGKNLFLECLKFCRAVVDIDGKDFDKKDKFKFQTVADDTQIVSIDDYEGDIKELFTRITGHFEIEKKGMQKVVKDFEQSPKIFVSSNSAPKGFSSSYKRRLQLVEFSNYYNENHTPSDEFGDRDFFSDEWNQEDYNCLYSFLFDCVQYYLKHGLEEVQSESAVDLHFKQFANNTSRDFADYFIDYDFSQWKVGNNILQEYCTSTREDITAQTFYSRLRKMCGIYGWTLDTTGRGSERSIRIIKK